MDSIKDIKSPYGNILKENILLNIIKECCADAKSKLSPTLVGKVNRIIADCDLSHYSSLHKLHTADESTSTILGVMQQTAKELTFDEQTELNQAVIDEIQNKIPILTSELETLKQNIGSGRKSRKDQIRELQNRIDEKLNILREQENEKVELMGEWLDHRLKDVSNFNMNSGELLSLKTRILELKSKILHVEILRGMFTETNQSIKAYSEVHKDLKDSIKETELEIKKNKDIIEKLL